MVYLFALLRAGAVKITEKLFEVNVQVCESTKVDVKGSLRSLISLNSTVIGEDTPFLDSVFNFTVTSPVV